MRILNVRCWGMEHWLTAVIALIVLATIVAVITAEHDPCEYTRDCEVWTTVQSGKTSTMICARWGPRRIRDVRGCEKKSQELGGARP